MAALFASSGVQRHHPRHRRGAVSGRGRPRADAGDDGGCRCGACGRCAGTPAHACRWRPPLSPSANMMYIYALQLSGLES